VRNRTGAAPKGVNRQEGNQTLKAERSGRACPRQVDLRFLKCCREQKPMGGANRLRPVGQDRFGESLDGGETRERIRLEAEQFPAKPVAGKPQSRGKGQRQSGIT